PLHEYTHAHTGLRQKLQMHERPGKPRKKPAHVYSAALQHSEALAHYRHVALVKVAEWRWSILPCYSPMDQPAGIAPLLHRDLRHTRKRLAVLIERCRIAHHENLRETRNREILPDEDAPPAIGDRAQPLASRRRRYARRPDDCPAADTLSSNHHAIF